ncbi:sensor histidine kinase [Parasphingorhabdus sp.]|uniref:sensor histidine kinase n=1 Tax=Parasphingorhabdus sp. TaxID=2709688 RepID=UPI0030038857
MSKLQSGEQAPDYGSDPLIFKEMANNLPVLCWMADSDGYITWYNERWHRYCGTTPAEMEGWGWQSVHDPQRLPHVMEAWTGSIASGEAFDMTFPLRGADGVYRPFLTRITPYRDATGEITHWFGINIDVTEQDETARRLKIKSYALERVLAERQAILDQLGEGVIITDAGGEIVYMNERAQILHGQEQLGVSPDDYTAAFQLLTVDREPYPVNDLPLTRAVRDNVTTADSEWVIRRGDGSEILAKGNAKPVYDDNGEKIAAVLTIRDVTKNRANERALKEALEAKEMLLYEVNHRVKNSLQLVTSLLSLQSGQGSPELQKSLENARARIGVVARLHGQLYLTSSHDRIAAGAFLESLVTETVDALKPSDGVRCHTDIVDEVVLLLDQAIPLAIVVSELVTNALKYAFDEKAEGTVSLSVRRMDDGKIRIEIADDGHGLPSGFDPAASSGLGMRVSYALVQQLRGELTFSSSDQGTIFSIMFEPMPLKAEQ